MAFTPDEEDLEYAIDDLQDLKRRCLRRVYTLLIILSMAVNNWAQVQQGFVKTLGRPDKKGEALSGVSIRMKGGHNAVLSKSDGTFSMLMTGKKNGDAYSLQQVQKTGYELNEIGVIGRQYAFSDRVPLYIVMVSTAQLQADKQRIENNAYKVAERNYHAKTAQLEKDKEAGTITIEQYRKEIQDLQDKFEKYQSLINDLAEHYAHTDYDGLDEKEREINICIENGDLERADSLIHTVFDPVDVLKRNKEALTRIDQNLQQANDIITQANADMAAVLKQQEKDAEYLYHLYTISTGRFDFKEATYYIETRAALDTTNAKWQFDAGKYLYDQNQFHKAAPYYERALKLYRQLTKNDPQAYEPDLARTLVNLGLLYSDTQRLKESEVMFIEALEIYRRLAQSNPRVYEPNVAGTLNSFAILYYKTHRFAESEAMYKETLETYKRLVKSNPQVYEPDVALTLNNLANLYSDTQRLAKSETMYEKALEIYRRLALSNPQTYEPYVAGTLGNLAILYKDTQHFTESETMYKEALETYRRLVKSNPQVYEPDVALTLNNLANLYSINLHDLVALYDDTQLYANGENPWAECETMYKEALGIYRRLAQSNPQAYEPNVARTLNNLANLYSDTQRLAESEMMYKETLEIYKRLALSNPQTYEPYVAMTLYNLANLYKKAQRFAESETMYKEALDIYKRLAVANSHEYNSSVERIKKILQMLENPE